MERHVVTEQDALVDLLASPPAWRSELVRNHLMGRMARRLASGGSSEDFAGCAKLLCSSPDSKSVDIVIGGMDLGLAGRQFDPAPAALQEPLAELWSKGQPSPVLIRFAARLGYVAARQKAQGIALDARRNPEERVTMIELLGQIGGPENCRVLLRLFGRERSEALTLEVVKALGRFADPEIAAAVLRRYPTMTPNLRGRALDMLASRKDWSLKLIVGLGPTFRRQPVSLVQKILQHKDPQLLALVEKTWGRVQHGTTGKAEIVQKLSGIVGPAELFSRPGRGFDRAKGKEIFVKRCASCHTLFGEGGTIGPDLTAADRRSVDQLLTNIVDPSASIRREYTSFNLELKDGRMLTGFILDPTPESLVVQDAKGDKTVISRRDVKEAREAAISLMPEDLLNDLDHQSLVDFFAYLTWKGPMNIDD